MASPAQSQSWCFPVDGKCTATVTIDGGAFTLAHIQTLRAHLEVLERNLCSPDETGTPAPESIEPAQPGDLVQLRPAADPTFGGLMLRVTQTHTIGIRGYLLVPHRGGCRDAWLRWKHNDYGRVGRVRWPEARWGFRDYATFPAAAIEANAYENPKRPPRMERGVEGSFPASFRTAKGD